MIAAGFFFLLLLLLPTQLGFHFWPKWATVLGRRVDYLAPTLYLTDIIVVLLLLSWFWEEVSKVKHQLSKIYFDNPKIIISILVMAFAIINVLVSANKPVAIYKWLKVFEFLLLAYYIVRTKPGISKIISALSIGIFYASLLAIVQFYLQHSLGGVFWLLGERIFNLNTPGIARAEFCGLAHASCRLLLRPYATFPHPNVLGGFLAATLPLIIFQFTNLPINQFTKAKKIWLVFTLGSGLTALVLTFSRSAFIVGSIGIIFVLWQTNKFKKILYTVLLILGFTLVWQIKNLAFADESVAVRSQLNDAAAKLWQASPLVGVGLGNYLVKLPEVLPSRTVYFLQPVHNIYLLVLAEGGIIGLLMFFWIIYKALRLEISDKRKALSKTRLFLFAEPLIAILLLGLIDHYPFDLQQGQLLLTVFFAWSLTRNTRDTIAS